MYGTQLEDRDTESADMYMYRLAEKKSIQIGKVTRLLKENAIDCLLNKNLQDFTEKKMKKKVKMILSSGKEINFSLGDKNNSIICDFMNCDYKCKPQDNMPTDINISTYNENFIIMNIDKILQRIRLLFKEKYVYEKKELIKSINAVKSYPIDQIMTGLDYLINNASRFYPTKLTDVSEKTWNDTINTNIKTPLFLAKYFYRELKKRKGVIINIIDIHVEPPLKDHIVYNISKAGLLALTRSLAKDLAPHIRVNGVSPGAIMWPEIDSSSKKKKDIISKIPMKSTGEPLDIAKAVYFFLSQAPYITGQNINIDGGRRLNM